MNAVEIEKALLKLATLPFDKETFIYDFLECFGNISTTLTRLKTGDTNKTDVPDAVLQKTHIHIKLCGKGEATETLDTLRKSPATKTQKVKLILATDGDDFQAQDMTNGDICVCSYTEFGEKFGFFQTFAGFKTVETKEESSFDRKATRVLDRLYMELLKTNTDWALPERRPDMNLFMARLIFCFFAEDTIVFNGDNLFTNTVDVMSQNSSFDRNRPSITHKIIGEIFRAMNTKKEDRHKAKIENLATKFPYVNGGLFSGDLDVPIFSRDARNYLLHIGRMDWKKINPDIFGSMIQTVASDAERGAVGMHYTSVSNILKVLNPLFLDNLWGALELAHQDTVKLKALRGRIARIRVFDPACGSGNFLVIAYKNLRKIEADINTRLGEATRKTDIPLDNFRGIELGQFAAEVARLALIIAKYQCDTLYCEVQSIIKGFLPLDSKNWITQGNALRMDWFTICPQTDESVNFKSNNLLDDVSDKPQIDFKNKGGETYICGNPPYLGSKFQAKEQKEDMKAVFERYTNKWASLDYVTAWFMKAAEYGRHTHSNAAFVSTNSICQGQQVAILWSAIFATEHEITFAYTSFKWKNLASHNAVVTVIIVGIGNHAEKQKRLFSTNEKGESRERQTDNINAYLLPAANVIAGKFSSPLFNLPKMTSGNIPRDGGNLSMTWSELTRMELSPDQQKKFIRQYSGSEEFIHGKIRYCLWVEDKDLEEAMAIEPIRNRIDGVRQARLTSTVATIKAGAIIPHKFLNIQIDDDLQKPLIVVPCVSSETRGYLPVGILEKECVISNRNFALYDAPLWAMAIIASRIHWVWIATVCNRLETRISYSNVLGWNTFPIPDLTPLQKTDLTRCAENILLAREAHFPATIADLYEVKNGQSKMPDDLATAHRQNDEVLERIYKGRVFKNDTERLETLFEMYTKMTGGKTA